MNQAQALKSSRAASSLPPAATYLVDFSNSVFEFVRRQLNEIVLPLTHHAGLGLSSRPGMSVKGRARNTLSEEQGRARFLARWKYLCALTDRLAREGLIERTTWASKTIDWVATCHIAQLGWVIDLVADTCLDDILRVGWMCKSLVGALVSRLVDLNAYPSQETPDALIVETTVATQSLLRRIWLRNNNAFIVPQIHAQPESLKLLKDVALIDGADSVHWQDVIHRIESLHCENGQSDQETDDTRYVDIEDGSPDRPKPAGSVLERHRCLEQAPGAQYFLSILDVWTTQEPLSELCSRYLAPLPSPLLDRRTSHTSAPTPSSNTKYVPATPIGLRLDLLLNWAVSSCRFGDHRRYLALHVCKVYLDPPQYIELSSGRAEQPQPHRRHRQAMMQRSIVNLLDSLDGSSQRDLDAAVHLCCELVSHAVLDVASLLQMIVTRGVSPVVSRSPTHSIYLRILKESSAHIASQSLRYQLSKIASSTDSHDVECLDNALSQERYSVSRQLSLLVDASEGPGDRITRAADTESGDIYKEGLTSARKRELYSTWLVPPVVGNINESLDTDGRYEEQLALLIQILQSVGAYDCILQVSYAVLAHSSNHIILELITDVLQARMQIWRPKGATEEILEAAWQTHRRLVAQNGLSMPLAGLILDLGQDIPEGKLQIEDLATDIAAFQNPEEVSDLFPAFPDQYTNNTRIDSPSLAGSVEPRVRARQLLHLHAHDPEFPRNTITDILSQLSEHGGSALSDTIELFLVIHQSLPSGLDGSLMAALQSSGSQGLVTMLQLPAGSLGLIRFLQAVVLRGGLDLSVLLQDAIEPALHICLSQLDTRLPEMIQLAERMLILLEPFWSWEEIDDADSLRLEARFIGSLVSDSIDFVLSCLSHLLAIADALGFRVHNLVRLL